MVSKTPVLMFCRLLLPAALCSRLADIVSCFFLLLLLCCIVCVGPITRTLSTLFVWSVVTQRLGPSVPKDKLLISNCTIVVTDDELAFWTMPTNKQFPGIPQALVANSNSDSTLALFSQDWDVRVSGNSYDALPGDFFEPDEEVDTLVDVSRVGLTINSLSARTGAWRMSNVKVTSISAVSKNLVFPVEAFSTGNDSCPERVQLASPFFNAGGLHRSN